MARGVFIEINHAKGCPATGKDARRCRCSPSARARVAGVWVPNLKMRLQSGWRQSDLEALELVALQAKQDHDSGRKMIEPLRVPTLTEWGERYLDEVRALVAEGTYSPSTLAVYESRWYRYIKPVLGDLLLTRVTTARVNELRASMRSGDFSRRQRIVHEDGHVTYARKGLSDDSASQVIQLLAAILNDAIPKYVDTNAAATPRRLRRRHRQRLTPDLKREKVLDLDFARALLASTEGVLQDLILTALSTGLRRRELAGLRAEQLHLRDGRLVVDNQLVYGTDALPKMQKLRIGIVCPSLADRLQLRLEHTDGYVFLMDDGKPFNEFWMNKLLNEAWEAIGPRPRGYSWHVLRHTFATTLRAGGVSQFVIDALMGHGADGVPALYQHVLDQELEHAIEVVEIAYGVSRDSNPNLLSEARKSHE